MPLRGSRTGSWARRTSLLALAALMWGGNAIAGRLAVGRSLAHGADDGRAGSSCCIVLRPMSGQAASCANGRSCRLANTVLWMGALRLHHLQRAVLHGRPLTTAVNMTILQGAIPVLRSASRQCCSSASASRRCNARHGDHDHRGRGAGVEGELQMLRSLRSTSATSSRWSPPTLRRLYARPAQPAAGSRLSFFTAMAAVAFVTSLPLLALEIARGTWCGPPQRLADHALYRPVPLAAGADLLHPRVELIGPSRAGVFVNLVPVFGAFLAVLILREPSPSTPLACFVLAGSGCRKSAPERPAGQ